ncbi:MAG: tetratricopeptide repeat protein [Planctomycetaceae bacterium]
MRINVGGGTRTRGSDFNRSRITNRPFDGNTVNFNNRRFNVGHNSYQPSYYRHSGYHGYWNGNRGFGGGSGYWYGRGSNYGYGGGYGAGWGWGLGNGYGDYGVGYGGGYAGYGRGYRGYGYRPFGWGLGGWGLGSIIYNSGYLGYSNPYYVDGGWSGYNYSQPVVVTYNTSSVIADNDPNSAGEVLTNAIAAFQQNDYDAALDITNKGITQFPDDAVLHEFRSLVLFAKQDYQQSASTIHSVLAVGPGWDWTTLSSMYVSVAIYTEQLRALEAFTKANPKDAASRFLLAYHYMSCGHAEPAARQLRQVVQLMPNDRVASDMLKMVAPPEVAHLDETTLQPEQELTRPAPTSIDPAMLVGTWKAAREDGSTFGLTLTNDAQFKWSFAQKDQPAQEFEGTYSFEENVLALERSDGGSLIAEVTPGGDAMFNFKLIGAPEDDPGLDFNK